LQGKTTIVHDDSWQYCALVPAQIGAAANGNGSQFGLGPANDMLAVYNTAFGMNEEDYRILTVCIFEVNFKKGIFIEINSIRQFFCKKK
jgi:hypothetical protein